MRQPAAGGLHRVVQLAVGIRMRAVEQLCGRLAEVIGPMRAHPPQIAADAAGRHHQAVALDFKRAAAIGTHAQATPAPCPHRFDGSDLVPGCQRQVADLFMTAQRVEQRARHVPRRAPDHVVARHGVAGTEQPAFHPLHGRDEANAKAAQPFVDVRHAAFEIVLGPRARPGVVFAEFGHALPVRPREGLAVVDARAPLQRRVDQAHPAESLQRQPAQRGFVSALEKHDALPRIEQLDRGHDAGEAATGNDRVITRGGRLRTRLHARVVPGSAVVVNQGRAGGAAVEIALGARAVLI
jgi:hypothetical protein